MYNALPNYYGKIFNILKVVIDFDNWLFTDRGGEFPALFEKSTARHSDLKYPRRTGCHDPSKNIQ